jgi:hypothetical protein
MTLRHALITTAALLLVAPAANAQTPLLHTCALKNSGVLRYVANPASCNAQYEVGVAIRPGPTHVCAGPLGLLVRKVDSVNQCGSSRALTIPAATPANFCAAVRIGGWLRHVSGPSRCLASEVPLVAVNRRPTITLNTTPAPGDPFQIGDTVAFRVAVIDDDPVDCGKVHVTYVLGHETHGHAHGTVTGCSGVVATHTDASHSGSPIFAVIVAQYVDAGGLAVNDQIVLTPSP